MRLKANKFMIFMCQHDDPSWCDRRCTKIISKTKWLDIIYKGEMVKINGEGKICQIKNAKRV